MLPGSRSVDRWTMSMVTSPEGDEHAAADAASEPGPGRPGRAGTPLPHHPRRRDPDPLPDGPAQRAGSHPTPDRSAGPVQPRHRPPGAQPLPWRWAGRGPAPAPPRPATPLPAWVGARAGPGGRLGPPRGRGRQCAVDVSVAGRLPARGHRPPGGDRDGQDRAAPGRVCLQAAPLGPDPQGPRPAGVGKKRLFQRFRGSFHARSGSGGHSPPTLSIASAISALGERNPNATRVSSRILVLVDSTSPLDSPSVSAAWMLDRWAVIVLASFTNAGMRQRLAHPSHASSSTVARTPLSLNTNRSCSLSR